MPNSMKRSDVNRIMREADQFIRSFGYILPPFAYWSPAEFTARKHEARAIIDHNLGWDITDYGLGDFMDTGLFLFTVRNGNNADLSKGRGMLYAEKAMISRQDQYSPMHRHHLKAEDIINRGGGTLVIELFGDTGGEIDRNMPVLDVSKDNDWSKVRVWDPRSGQYGARVYAISGFIERTAPVTRLSDGASTLYVKHSPDTCGNRPCADGAPFPPTLAETPFSSICLSSAPLTDSVTTMLPNGSTASDWPRVIRNGGDV